MCSLSSPSVLSGGSQRSMCHITGDVSLITRLWWCLQHLPWEATFPFVIDKDVIGRYLEAMCLCPPSQACAGGS